MASRLTLPLLLVLGTLAGCSQKNATCSYPVVDPERVVVALASPLPPLSREQLSGRETGFGDALVDSYRQALAEVPGAPAIALDVVSSVRDDGVCPLPDGGMTRPTLPDNGGGEVTTRALRDAFPGPDHLVIVRLTLNALFNVLEHGVTGPVGRIETSSGRFVLVSGLSYTVDCAQPPEGATQLGVGVVRTMEGRRVIAVQIDHRTYTRADAQANTTPIEVAMPESLARGGDQFFDLRDAFTEQGQSAWSETSIETYETFESYLRGLGAALGGRVSLRTDGRITFVNCSTGQ